MQASKPSLQNTKSLLDQYPRPDLRSVVTYLMLPYRVKVGGHQVGLQCVATVPEEDAVHLT